MNTQKNFKDSVNSNAKLLLTNEFYWDLENHNSPFSLNRVSNTFTDFIEWRKKNLKTNITDYFPEIGENELIFDRNKTDLETVKAFYEIHSNMQKEMFGMLGNLMDSITSQVNELTGKDRITKKISQEEKNEILERTANQMGATALMEHDDEIITVGFAQFVTEGTIDKDMKVLTEKAIQRQLLPYVLDQFEDIEFRKRREVEFKIMLEDLNKIK